MKSKQLIGAILLVGYAACVRIGSAHHSVSGVFNTDESITVRALVKEFRFIDPHPYATASRLDGEGRGEEWTLNFDNRWELAEDGFSGSTLRPGDELVVTGNPARSGANALYVRGIERPLDGFVYIEDADEREGND